jgi:hypothetical protein
VRVGWATNIKQKSASAEAIFEQMTESRVNPLLAAINGVLPKFEGVGFQVAGIHTVPKAGDRLDLFSFGSNGFNERCIFGAQRCLRRVSSV